MNTIVIHFYNGNTISAKVDASFVVELYNIIQNKDVKEILIKGEDYIGTPIIEKIYIEDIDYIEF